MNKTVKFLAMGAIFLSSSLMTVNAQTGTKKPEFRKELAQKSPEEKADFFANRLAEKLNLSEQQKKEVYTLKLIEIKAHEALMQQQKALRLKAKSDLDKVLTPEQRTKLEELKANKAENFKNKGYPNRPANPNQQGGKGSRPVPTPSK